MPWSYMGDKPKPLPDSATRREQMQDSHSNITTQRSPERRGVDRTSLSCAWLEAPHKQIYNQGGSPQISRTIYHHKHTYTHT